MPELLEALVDDLNAACEVEGGDAGHVLELFQALVHDVPAVSEVEGGEAIGRL